MAKACWFDIVSEFVKQELVNVVDQVKRELTTKFDIKSSNSDVVLDLDKAITITTNDEMKLRNILDILKLEMIKRGLNPKILDAQAVENAPGGNVRQVFNLKKGLTQELSKKIVTDIKNTKLKVQAVVQGERVRVSGNDENDLQAVIKMLRENEDKYEVPLQFQNYTKLEQLTILEKIVDKFNNINKIYKNSFIVFFVVFFILFFYNHTHFLYGNHDLDLIYDNIRIQESLYIGRFSATLIEYMLCSKNHIPLLSNIYSYIFLSIGIILLLNYYECPKKKFNYIFLGLFLIINPYLYFIFYYKILSLSFSCIFLFGIVSLKLTDKANEIKSKKQKIIYFITATTIMTVFVFGTYPPVIGFILLAIIGKFLINLLEKKYDNFLQLILEKKYTILMILLSILLELFIYYFLKKYGYLEISRQNTTLINMSEIGEQFIFYIKNSIFFLFTATYPYIDKNINILLAFINFLGFVTIITYLFNKLKKGTINNIKILTVYFSCFLFSQIIFLLSPGLYYNPLYRLQYWSNIQFSFFSLILIFKYGNIYIRNILIFILLFFYTISINSLYLIQKNQFQASNLEFDFNKNINQRIKQNNFFYNNKNYNVIFIGEYPNFHKKIYNSNKYNYESELLYSLSFPLEAENLIGIISRAENKVQYNKTIRFETMDEKRDFVLKHISTEIYKKMKAYPSQKSIFIDNKKNLIFVLLMEIK